MKRAFFQEVGRLLEPIGSNPKVATNLIVLTTIRGVWAGGLAYLLREITNAYQRSPQDGQRWIGLFAILFLIYHIFNRWIQRTNPFRFNMLVVIVKYCHQKYLQRFFYLDQHNVEKLGTGKLITIVDKGIETRAAELNMYMSQIPNLGIQLMVGVRVATMTHRIYGISFLVFCVLTIAAFGFAHKGGIESRKQRTLLQSERTRNIVRLLAHKIEVLQSKKISLEIGRLADLEDQITVLHHKRQKAGHTAYLVVNTIISALRILVYLTIGAGIADAQYSFGELVAGLTIVATLESVMHNMRELQKGWIFGLDNTRHLRDFFDETPLMQEGNKLPLLSYKKGSICLDNVSFSYEDKFVLQGFDLSIEPGKIYALVGPSGGGKSTLIKLIAGLLRPNTGTISVDGQNIHEHDLKSYYECIGYLTQEPSVFDGTVRENLMYGLGKEDLSQENSKTDDILKKTQCHFVYDLPHGLDTEIGERGVRLSGGQKQRLAIAKIMLKNPEIILLDEPTSALDSMSEELVSQAMQELFKNRTVVIIAHRLQTVKHADKILYIDRGQIVEEGTHEELTKQGGNYAKMLNIQTSFG